MVYNRNIKGGAAANNDNDSIRSEDENLNNPYTNDNELDYDNLIDFRFNNYLDSNNEIEINNLNELIEYYIKELMDSLLPENNPPQNIMNIWILLDEETKEKYLIKFAIIFALIHLTKIAIQDNKIDVAKRLISDLNSSLEKLSGYNDEAYLFREMSTEDDDNFIQEYVINDILNVRTPLSSPNTSEREEITGGKKKKSKKKKSKKRKSKKNKK